ncbi:unnamed protein product [Rotaria magnacalcarata]|uniref:Uncharacterized protein n=1 Tax=Rotaria magnacalcarata TaxID=392030 RepID=A0A815DJ78_9BILA|nr:unnamed protein product [Rotaria magnacalcarata]CAF1685642.1 unnamed protein product [Rotaria magnacalcarata]CAF1971747.1 unnamed protein product [Rotaria magnacalcarata]CAF2150049.1 unnamed protein product [Rotaria magnacalcarata]CAF3792909.1 unnamed protein product [Rotaria magnacalcarata]
MEKFHNASNRRRFRFLAILGILLFLIGLASLILTVIDLFHGKPSAYNFNESEGGLKIENPLWPSSGKGFWVGLVLMVTGLLGILSSREGTRASIIGFTALSIVSTVLSFYMIITCTISVQNYTKSSVNPKPRWQSNELILNALLIATGALGSIVGAITSIFGCVHGNCCVDQRDSYLISPNVDQAIPGTPSSMIYPSVNVARMSYPYQQTNFRISM